MLRYGVYALILGLLAGCSSGQPRGNTAAAGPTGLPSVAEAARTASYIAGVRDLDGAQYETAGPFSHVTVDEAKLTYAATLPLSEAGDLSYATYALDLNGYGGPAALGLRWSAAAPIDGIWVGLANWDTASWDWRTAPADEITDIGDYTPYVNPDDGRMLLLVLSVIAQPSTLDHVWFGEWDLNPPQDITDTWDTLPPGKVQLKWDPPAGDGDPPSGYNVWRSSGGATGPYENVAFVGGTNYIDFDVASNTAYWYKVSAASGGTTGSIAVTHKVLTGPQWHYSTFNGPYYSADPEDDICIWEHAGNPLVACTSTEDVGAGSTVHVQSALDPYGAVWDNEFSITRRATFGKRLAMVGGYLNWLNAGINGYYQTSTGGFGQMWSVESNSVDDMSGTEDWLSEVAGVPAIHFGKGPDHNWILNFDRADNPFGSQWPNSHKVIDQNIDSLHSSLSNLVIVDGKPAFYYARGTDQKMMLAQGTNSIGFNFTTAEAFDIDTDPAVVVVDSCAMLVQGQPALFYTVDEGASGQRVRYTRYDGVAWSTPLELCQVLPLAQQCAFSGAVIGGRPALLVRGVTYGQGEDYLGYFEALDDLGGAWHSPVILDGSCNGLPTLAALDDGLRPGVAYLYGMNKLRFVTLY